MTACANADEGSAATGENGATAATGATAPTGPTATETTSPDSPTPTSEPPAAELEDGRHFGFVRSVDVGGTVVVFDLAYFLTGDAATEAAEAHGDEAPPPNDYYIVNDNPKLRHLELSSKLVLVLLDWNRCCEETFRGDLDDFAAAINGGASVTVGDKIYQGTLSPYWLTVESGIVTTIEEQFLP